MGDDHKGDGIDKSSAGVLFLFSPAGVPYSHIGPTSHAARRMRITGVLPGTSAETACAGQERRRTKEMNRTRTLEVATLREWVPRAPDLNSGSRERGWTRSAKRAVRLREGIAAWAPCGSGRTPRSGPGTWRLTPPCLCSRPSRTSTWPSPTPQADCGEAGGGDGGRGRPRRLSRGVQWEGPRRRWHTDVLA